MFVGPEHWYLFQVNYLAPRTLRWLLDFWEIGVIFILTPFFKDASDFIRSCSLYTNFGYQTSKRNVGDG
jgi:hypothetical protein